MLGFLSVATIRSGGDVTYDSLFQSRAGFSLRRDEVAVEHSGGVNVFQSRAGFSLRRDVARRPRLDRGERVSIPCWVFSPSRRVASGHTPTLRRVSIPCWVFSPSRPESVYEDSGLPTSFNPVLGFLSVATSPRRWTGTRTEGFNPVLGFLSVATIGRRVRTATASGFNPVLGFLSVATSVVLPRITYTPKFQSRAGFSLRRDEDGPEGRDLAEEFQSRAGFSLRRDARHHRDRGRRSGFQSRAGFSLRRDCSCVPEYGDDGLFQSRAGFSLRRDDDDMAVLRYPKGVSIPCWVFSPSRLELRIYLDRRYVRFNPVLGFLSVATGLVADAVGVVREFQSRAGFSLRRDGVGGAGVLDPGGSFNPVLGFLSVATLLRGTRLVGGLTFQSRAGFSLRRDVKEAVDSVKDAVKFQSRAGFSLRRDW